MAQEKLFIGIDLNYERAMVSLFHEGMQEVETVSSVPGEEHYQIPAAVFCTGQGNYFYGDEALRRQDRTDGSFFSDLYLGSQIPDNVICRNMLVQFLRRLIRFRERYDLEHMDPYLAVTVPQITDDIVELFRYVQKELGFAPDHFRLMDYGESFFAHTYHQDPSIRMHDVALFDFQNDKIFSLILHTDGMGTVKRVTSERREWTVPGYLLDQPDGKDEFFANILREAFMKKIISGVYFIGDGFDGDWLRESLRVIGPNKRVFKGKNLYTRGACLAAYRNEVTEGWHYYYDCFYKLHGEISLKLLKNGEPYFLRLTQLGENWFAPTETYYLMYDEDPRLEVWVRVRERLNARIENCTLDYLPERDAGSIRLSVKAVPVSGTKVVLRVEDDGFGEMFEPSGKVWEFPIVTG